MIKLTTSFESLISAHSVVNSHTSRKSTSTASAKAAASSAVRILNLKTTSPPYLDSTIEGGVVLEGGLGPFIWQSICGTLQIFLMRPSRHRDKMDLCLWSRCTYWGM